MAANGKDEVEMGLWCCQQRGKLNIIGAVGPEAGTPSNTGMRYVFSTRATSEAFLFLVEGWSDAYLTPSLERKRRVNSDWIVAVPNARDARVPGWGRS